MHADERTRVVIHREWVLDTPAHHTEVAKALMVAGQKHDAEPGHASDIVFDHGDDYLIIGYEVEQEHASELGHAVDKIVRADLAEWRRKAELFQATIARVRELARTWASWPDGTLREQAGRELLHVLDLPAAGTGAKAGEPAHLGGPSPDDAATVRAYEDLLGAISLYVDWRFVTKQLTTEQKNLWADAHDAWSSRMDHDEPSKAERWWAQ